MKVLHIWDVAGVANTIAKFMDRLHRTESYVMSRKKFDPFGLNTYTKPLNYGATRFFVSALLKARKYEVAHVHAWDKIIHPLKMLYRKPIVISYYGSDIRNKWKARQKNWSHADTITFSTQELFNEESPKTAIWMPCPVDTDLFYPRSKRKAGTALTFSYEADNLANEYARRNKLTLTNIKRNIPYPQMADLLSQYEYYIDVKEGKGKVTKALSKTGLEALACNCKVIRWDGKIVEKLPEEHKAENVARKLYEIYLNLLGRKIE